MSNTITTAIDKLTAIEAYLNAKYFKRAFQIRACLAAVVAGENVVMVGPPGTAKSDIARDVLTLTHEGGEYEQIFQPFITPDAVIGKMDIIEYQNGHYQTDTTGRLTSPRVTGAFLDEIFKAPGKVTSSLLDILNERTIKLEGDEMPRNLSLECCIGASNELPEGFGGRRKGEIDQTAYWDRWTVRVKVQDDLTDKDLVAILRQQYEPPARPEPLTTEERHGLMQAAHEVTWADSNPLLQARKLMGDRGVKISVRRFKKLMHVAKAHAVCDGSSRCRLDDYVFAVKTGMWHDDPDISKVFEILPELGSPADQTLAAAIEKIQEVAAAAQEGLKRAETLNALKEASLELKEETAAVRLVLEGINEVELSEPARKAEVEGEYDAFLEELREKFKARFLELQKGESFEF